MQQRTHQPKYAAPRRRRRRRRSFAWLWATVRFSVFLGAVLVLGTVALSYFDMDVSACIADATAPGRGDTTPPVITGVKDITVYEGSTILYRDGVQVSDDGDAEPTLTIDTSRVDAATPGTYEVIYTATDISGNTASQSASVTVLDWLGGFTDLDTIYESVDARLANLITDGMTVREQVEAIYTWARSSLGYSGAFAANDRFQAAYRMLTDYSGDCYGYYAVTKLMFDRLGIPNIDVQKVRNSPDDSDHYWSLVSIDGGQSYYHFDATPRYGDGDDFCLVTDAFLDAYSENHKNCHNRDQSLYPATPEEGL